MVGPTCHPTERAGRSRPLQGVRVTVKRFYKSVNAESAGDGTYRVKLDGRELRSPEKRPLALPTAALAEAVAAEWDAQREAIDIRSMPLMALASTAVDRTGPMRGRIVDEIVRHAETDLVCYRAEGPVGLAGRQEQIWQPLLDWLAMRYDSRLAVQAGIMPRDQPREAVLALRLAVEALDDRSLASLSSVTAATGSLVIALALVDGRIGPDDAVAASQLDEIWQSETWGEDPEAVRRRAALAFDIAAAHRFLLLLRA